MNTTSLIRIKLYKIILKKIAGFIVFGS